MVAYSILSIGAIWFVFLMVIVHSLGRPSHYVVDSIDATVVSYVESDTLDVLEVSECKDAGFEGRSLAVIIKPVVSYDRVNTGTFEPGVLGARDTILEIKSYLVAKGMRLPIELGAVDSIDRFRVYGCNGNLLAYDDRTIVSADHDTSFYYNSSISGMDDYVHHLNYGRLHQFNYSILGIHDSLGAYFMDTVDYSVELVAFYKEK
jgi:hypothetical protein